VKGNRNKAWTAGFGGNPDEGTKKARKFAFLLGKMHNLSACPINLASI